MNTCVHTNLYIYMYIYTHIIYVYVCVCVKSEDHRGHHPKISRGCFFVCHKNGASPELSVSMVNMMTHHEIFFPTDSSH